MSMHGLVRRGWLAAVSVWMASMVTLPAQWLTQSFDLQPGWNAVFLHVDASYATLDDQVAGDSGNPIGEVWQWNSTVPDAQFVQSPLVPTETGTPWTSWVRGLGASSVLQRLSGNTAYLVKVDGPAAYTWSVKGRPLAPRYRWTTSGLNFLGFATVPTGSPSFATFLGAAPGVLNVMEVFRYPGGPLGAGNPVQVLNMNTTSVRRGEAFWLRAGDVFNRYFGPFEVVVAGGTSVGFGDHVSQKTLRLRNTTAAVLAVTGTWVASETAPTGQPPIVGAPPVLVRGALNPTNLTYAHTDLSVPVTWSLKPAGEPGSEVEVVLGVNRSAMAGSPGDEYAGVLRLTDSLGLSQIDLPVSATVTSQAGLWVGAVSVDQVRHYLNTYERDGDGAPMQDADGKYMVTGTKTNLGTVARSYPLRLIVHTDAVGAHAKLLQRAYLGVLAGGGGLGVATRQGLLDPDQLATARRVTAVHLPWSEANAPWDCQGELRAGTNLTSTVVVDVGDGASNPFVHTYHPDHDNLDATFEGAVAPGEESYEIQRKITLSVASPEDDFASLTAGHARLVGQYDEAITLVGKTKAGRSQPESRQFEVRGGFTLTRITEVPVLTTE